MIDQHYLQLLRSGVETGNWSGLQHYLRTSGPGDLQVPEALVQHRYSSGCCIGCGRKPCSGCGKKNPVWCDVCWDTIVSNCPEGMVVSGLARILQLVSLADPGVGDQSPGACMQRLLRLETPEDAEKIRGALEEDWEKDWNGAFTRAADKVLGKPWYREGP